MESNHRRWRRWLAVIAVMLLAAGGALTATAGSALAGAPYSCTVTGAQSNCPTSGDYNAYPGIPMSNGYNTYVANNCWADPSCSQTLQSNSASDWQVTANEPAGNGSVMTGPELQQQTNDWCMSEGYWDTGSNNCSDLGNVPVSALTAWNGTYSETMPHNSSTISEFAYDIWTNYPNDIMIWTDTVNRCNTGAYGSTLLASNVTLGDGHTYDVHRYGGPGAEIIFTQQGSGGAGTCAQNSSGTVDILGALKWVNNNVTAITDVSLIDDTFEVCSTGGSNETFTMTGAGYTTSTTGGGSTQAAPAVTTNAASNVTSTTATLNGSVNPEGAATTYKFDYGTTSSYGSATTAASAGSGSSPVAESANLTGLTAGTTYHYRVEASNSGGTSYGADQTFTMASGSGGGGGGTAPALVSQGAVSATGSPSFGQATTAGDLLVAWATSNDSSATFPISVSGSGWTLVDSGGSAYDWTGMWEKANSAAGETAPTFSDSGGSYLDSALAEYSGVATSSPLDKHGSGYAAAGSTVATSGADSQAGDLVVAISAFNGSNGSATLSDTLAGSQGTALSGTFTNNSGDASPNPYYDYGYAVDNATLGTNADAATPDASAYEGNAATVVASFAPSGTGGGGGGGQAPAVTTGTASSIGSATATLNGTVNPEGQATTYQFQYGTTTSYGSTSPATPASAGSGTSAVNESASLTGLSASTTYHYRIVATNATGTSYGADSSFQTTAAPVAFDAAAHNGTYCAGCASSLSWTHTVGSGATNRALVVGVGVGSDDDPGCSTTVKDGTTTMTELAKQESDNQTAGYLDVFGLVNPPTGAQTITVTVSGCTHVPNEIEGGSISFKNVSQSSPFSPAAESYGYSATPSVTVASTTSDMVAAFLANGSSITAANSGETSRFIVNQNGDTGAGNAAGATKAANGSNVTMGWSQTSDWWGAVGIDIQHA